MPLVADSLKFDALLNVDSSGKSFLPPVDVQWIWHCHRLNPVSVQSYLFSISLQQNLRNYLSDRMCLPHSCIEVHGSYEF